MSISSRSRMRNQWIMALAALLVLPNCLVAQDNGARLGTFDSTTGEIAFALSLQPRLATPAEVQPARIVIYFDTSASQNGLFRDDARKALNGVLQGLDPADQVQLYAVDLDPVPLTSDFVAPNSAEMKAALVKLEDRLPLGSTNMDAMLANAVELLDGDETNKNVLYIGDGISRGAQISTERAQSLISQLTRNRIAISSFAIGPERDVDSLATLANHTGGNVFIDTDDIGSCDQAAAGLVTTVRGSVFWPNRVTPSDQVTELFPSQTPPLRNDRDTILVGALASRDQISLTMSGTVNGKVQEFTWTASPEASDGDFRFLPARMAGGCCPR